MQSVTLFFDDNEEFDNIITAVRNIFIEDPSVVIYAAVDEKTDELYRVFEPPQNHAHMEQLESD